MRDNKYKSEVDWALEMAVSAGMLRKFLGGDGDYRYIDNRVRPTQEEIWQDKKLRLWTMPTDKEIEIAELRYKELTKSNPFEGVS